MKIWRCKWCIKRVGHATWYNERGETVTPPKWAIPTESETSDGICPQCLIEQTALIPKPEEAEQKAQVAAA